jgi:hypothetical protein
MPVTSYELDREVFNQLNQGVDSLKVWKGAASGIAEYVASWGLERFWSMSRSPVLLNGELPAHDQGNETDQRRYFAWGVARVVLCRVLGADLQIRANMDTAAFQTRLENLTYNQQILVSEVLIEIADAIQFWTMRLSDAQEAGQPA